MIAVISDIHGNLPALEAVLKEIKKKGIKSVINLGDVTGYYSMVNECIELLKDINLINILGNHDNYLINDLKCPRSKSANVLLDFQKKTIKKNNLEWLKQASNFYEYGDKIFVHGGLENILEEYIYKIDCNYFNKTKKNYLFVGHTHVQAHISINGKHLCNPGSVGQPRDGDWRAAYAILENDTVHLCRTPYDLDKIIENMKSNGFDDYFTENLKNGTRIGGQIDKIVLTSR